MSTTVEELEHWMMPSETEHLELTEANEQYDTTKLFKYCVAPADESGGKLILGVTDKPRAGSSVARLSSTSRRLRPRFWTS